MYIVRCRDDSLYTGWTNHLAEQCGEGGQVYEEPQTGGAGVL